MEPLVLRIPVSLSRQILWDYISTPEGLACWQADEVKGSLKEGEFSLRWPQLGARMDLSVESFVPENHLVLRAGSTALEMRLEDDALTLLHHGLHEDDDHIGLESSWRAALSVMVLAATYHLKQPRHIRWLFQPIVASAELAHYFFTDPRGLALWLGTTDEPLQQGQMYRLDINHQIITGEVLCSQRDVVLRVNEWKNAALTLRTLPAPDGKRVAALGISTFIKPISERVAENLETCLTRLSRSAHSAQS